MSFHIQMLGTGSAFAKKYYNNNALVHCNDYTLLIDCGITAPLSIHNLGVNLQDIDGLLITHFHADHIGGIEELAFRLKFSNAKKISLFVPANLQQSLWEHALKAGMDTGEEDCGLHTYFNVIPLHEQITTRICPGLDIEIIQTEHIPNKLSYSLIINQLLFYSADVRFNRPLLEQMHSKCKYILHDCQLEPPGLVHTTLDELLTLPVEIQEIIQLMHYGDDMEHYIGKTGKMTFLQQHKMYKYT